MYASEDMRSDDDASTVLAIAVVFNLALAHHLIGIERGSDSRSLGKAIKLYEYAFFLARSHGVDNGCVLFHMSIMNNLSQLSRALGHEEQAGKCFQQLLSMLMYLLDCSDGGASQYADFLANVSYLIVPNCSVAAAA
jgi:hypothetical protein